MPSDFTKIISMTMPLLTELSISNYLSSVAEKQPVPGGGAVAAIVGAEACALQTKVAVFSSNSEIAPIVESSKKTQRKLLELAEKDSKAFLALMKAGKKSKNYEELLIEGGKGTCRGFKNERASSIKFKGFAKVRKFKPRI